MRDNIIIEINGRLRVDEVLLRSPRVLATTRSGTFVWSAGRWQSYGIFAPKSARIVTPQPAPMLLLPMAESICENCLHWQSEFDVYGGRVSWRSKDEGYCHKHHDYQCCGDTCKDFDLYCEHKATV